MVDKILDGLRQSYERALKTGKESIGSVLWQMYLDVAELAGEEDAQTLVINVYRTALAAYDEGVELGAKVASDRGNTALAEAIRAKRKDAVAAQRKGNGGGPGDLPN